MNAQSCDILLLVVVQIPIRVPHCHISSFQSLSPFFIYAAIILIKVLLWYRLHIVHMYTLYNIPCGNVNCIFSNM